MIKGLIKKGVIRIKSFYWGIIVKNITDGLYLNKENIKHIAFGADNDIFRYPNDEEKKRLAHQTCGIASLKMITDYLGATKNKSIYEMTIESLKYKTFIIPEVVEKPEDIKGIFHEGLLNYAKSFGLNGFINTLVPLEKVIWYLKKDWLFLASVNMYQLYGGKWKNMKGGKHIVLVTGFEKKDGKIAKIFYKDIATSCSWNRETDEVNFKHFKNNFNYRGIFLKIDK
jgi:hypothetical protein